MAEYTLELREFVDRGVDIFNFKYDFYDEEKRRDFEQAFIRHFYFREIGCETIDRFRWYLEDKMRTVFPYYNELFKAAQIEYNILDNYNIREEYEIKREGVDKASGVSSTVGQVNDSQSSNTLDTRKGTTSLTSDGTGSRTDKETIDVDTTSNQEGTTATTASANGSKSETETTDNDTTITKTENGTEQTTSKVDGETTRESSSDTGKTFEDETKFLDTPQGLLTLKNDDGSVNYLTNLTYKNGSEDTQNTTTENGTSTDTKTESVSREGSVSDIGTNDTSRELSGSEERSEESNQTTKTEGSGTSDTIRDLTSNTTQKDTTTGSDESEDKITANWQGEQKSIHDNNTRSEKVGSHVETSVYTKKGNIGIDTDSDMITKHINLQKILKNIERMFFDECEDLFMLVY